MNMRPLDDGRPADGRPAKGRPANGVTRVLVVDDDPEVLAGLRGAIERAGMETAAVACVPDARHALLADHFDLVVTDLYLGTEELGLSVADAAQALRPPVPVILLTGRPSLNGAQEAIRSHVAELVIKPVGDYELVSACRRAIEDSDMRRRTARLETQNRVLASVLPRAIEVKDPTTKGHSDRVVRYADVLASRCGVSDADRESLSLASQLHDVGKIGIPNRILCKEGPLTSDEREVIKQHPQMGYEILAPLEDSDDVRRWVYQHHERWDGRGYPDGLAGDAVALPGRILILAEVYDALAEARSYKTAWDNNRIVEFFRAESGKHFDPDLAHLVADGLAQNGKRFFAPDGHLF